MTPQDRTRMRDGEFPPVCKNCLHFVSPLCKVIYDLTTGEPAEMEARDARDPNGWCGPEGALFEGK